MASLKSTQGIAGRGLENRRAPRGGAAKGIPRNTFTGSRLPSTVTCFPLTHPSLVYLCGSSAPDPEETHKEELRSRLERRRQSATPGLPSGWASTQRPRKLGLCLWLKVLCFQDHLRSHHHGDLPQLLLSTHHHLKDLGEKLFFYTKVVPFLGAL